MARLHEYQGKAILADAGIAVPNGAVARTPTQAEDISRNLGGSVMVKVQAWTTGRAAAGGIAKANTPDEAREHAQRMLAMTFGRFPVTEVLIEQRVAISREFFVSFAIDERERAPVLLLSASGGSGVEERAATTRKIPCHVVNGPDAAALRDAVASLNVGSAAGAIESTIRTLFEVARKVDARSLEINPLVLTSDAKVMAADCRMTIDDYAVARRPELGIAIARELDHPPTILERVAYQAEQDDHRGTFFFAQMNTEAPANGRGLIGFHGAGGGGSMMSMDAINAEGFTPANFCDTSGNPSPAKVYRAARVILQQPALVGYFGSGSGVANQEQFWSAYGLAKAFWEFELSIPAVIRLGGNSEDRAVDILESAGKGLPARVEGYKKTDPPAKIAARFAALVDEHRRLHPDHAVWQPRQPRRPAFVGVPTTHRLAVKNGTVHIDAEAWKSKSGAIIARANGVLKNDNGVPTPTGTAEEFLTKDSDMIACEVECRRDGIDGVFVELDLPVVEGGEQVAKRSCCCGGKGCR